MTLEIQVLAWDMRKNLAWLNRSLGFNSPLLITGSPPAIHTVKPDYNGHLGENDKMTTIYR